MELDGSVMPRNSRDETLELTFNTEEDSGLLVWKSQQTDSGLTTSDDYLLISLRDGRPQVEYELGGGPLVVSLPHQVDDGLPHTLRLVRTGRHLSLTLDDQHQQNQTSAGSFQIFNTEGNIFVGGGGPRTVTSLISGKSEVRTFVGCVHSLVINNKDLSFRNHKQSSNLVPCRE